MMPRQSGSRLSPGQARNQRDQLVVRAGLVATTILGAFGLDYAASGGIHVGPGPKFVGRSLVLDFAFKTLRPAAADRLLESALRQVLRGKRVPYRADCREWNDQ